MIRSSGRSTPSNPLRSNTGPRVTGFRDLASSGPSAGPSSSRFGGFGAGRNDDDDDDDDDEGRDPATFFTGGAKRCASSHLSFLACSDSRSVPSGLSVENPDDQRGGMADMVRNILQQARECVSSHRSPSLPHPDSALTRNQGLSPSCWWRGGAGSAAEVSVLRGRRCVDSLLRFALAF